MALKNLPFKPGIYEESTDRDVGKMLYWKDCDKVRFRDGLPEKIGGWSNSQFQDEFVGKVRGTADWISNDTSKRFLAFGTNVKLYALEKGSTDDFVDITPYAVINEALAADPFATTSGSPIVTVTDVSHGQSEGNYVTFSGAAAVAGITISGNYRINTIVNTDSYRITHTSNANATTTGGGASVLASYEASTGVESSSSGAGYGALGYGEGTYGTARTVSGGSALVTLQARTWSLDTWGEDLIANSVGGAIYVWDSSSYVTGDPPTASRATIIANAPTNNRLVFVSTEDRHLVALGADGDPLLIRWSDQEDYSTWTPALENTAGDKRLDVGTQIVAYTKIRGATLIFTNSFTYSMQFVGPPYTFAFYPLGDNGGIRGPLAVAAYEGKAYWMGEKEFYTYDGSVKILPCTIKERVFGSINDSQNAKICAGVNRAYNEVWWFYTSSESTENDRYFVYNIDDNAWYYGNLSRTAYVGNSDTFDFPYAFGSDGRIYRHETGTDEVNAPIGGGSDQTSAITAYIESGDVEIDQDGNLFQHVSKFIPDFKRLVGSVDITINGKRYPQQTGNAVASGPHTVDSTTKFINPRMRARQISVRIESDAVGDSWRTGSLRIDTLPHGRR